MGAAALGEARHGRRRGAGAAALALVAGQDFEPRKVLTALRRWRTAS
jgi:hypothetical protein